MGGKGPKPNLSKKQIESSDQPSYEKVKQYVEDLVVLREHLLKIEFRNIELEEAFAKKDRDNEELQS